MGTGTDYGCQPQALGRGCHWPHHSRVLTDLQPPLRGGGRAGPTSPAGPRARGGLCVSLRRLREWYVFAILDSRRRRAGREAMGRASPGAHLRTRRPGLLMGRVLAHLGAGAPLSLPESGLVSTGGRATAPAGTVPALGPLSHFCHERWPPRPTLPSESHMETGRGRRERVAATPQPLAALSCPSPPAPHRVPAPPTPSFLAEAGAVSHLSDTPSTLATTPHGSWLPCSLSVPLLPGSMLQLLLGERVG